MGLNKRGGQKVLDSPEYQELILEHVRQTGCISGCIAVLPKKANGKSIIVEKTVKNFIESNPDFKEKHVKAQDVFAAKHPEQNTQGILDSNHQLELMAKNGWVQFRERQNPKTGEIIERYIIRSPNIPRWVYEKYHPQPIFTEESLIFVLASMKSDLLDEEHYKECQRDPLRYVAGFKQRSLEELSKRGVKIKLNTEKLL